MLNYLEEEFWEAYPDTPAAECARLVKLAQEGHPFIGSMLTVRRGEDFALEYRAALVVRQRLDLERSVRYCHKVPGVGEKRASGH